MEFIAEDDPLQKLFSRLIDNKVKEMYIDENDAFVIIFSDDTYLELSSDEQLDLYWEYPSQIH